MWLVYTREHAIDPGSIPGQCGFACFPCRAAATGSQITHRDTACTTSNVLREMGSSSTLRFLLHTTHNTPAAEGHLGSLCRGLFQVPSMNCAICGLREARPNCNTSCSSPSLPFITLATLVTLATLISVRRPRHPHYPSSPLSPSPPLLPLFTVITVATPTASAASAAGIPAAPLLPPQPLLAPLHLSGDAGHSEHPHRGRGGSPWRTSHELMAKQHGLSPPLKFPAAAPAVRNTCVVGVITPGDGAKSACAGVHRFKLLHGLFTCSIKSHRQPDRFVGHCC